MTRKTKAVIGVFIIMLLGLVGFVKYKNLEVNFLSPFATSTPIIITQNQNEDKNNTEETKIAILSNFSFEYSKYDEFSPKVTWEGVPCPGEVYIRTPFIAYEPTGVSIATSPSTLCTEFNENAKTLADYEQGYKGNWWTTIVHSSERVNINNIPMLKQVYSIGYTKKDNEDKEILDTSDGVSNQLRYVFSDGSKFVIVKGWQAPKYIENIVRTIKLLPKK